MLLLTPELDQPHAYHRCVDDGLHPGETVLCELVGDRIWSLRARHEVWLRWCAPPSRLVPGTVLGTVEQPGALSSELVGLWMGSHCGFRAAQAVEGQGGVTAAATVAIHGEIGQEAGLSAIVDLVTAELVDDGDVLVVADKVIALATGRVTQRDRIGPDDPKHIGVQQRHDLATKLTAELGMTIRSSDLVQLDHLDDGRVTLGTEQPNRVAAALARLVLEATGRVVDVVVADSDTGVDCGVPLIGIPTVGASPLGATAGLSIYEAMRSAAAGEACRGHRRGIPIVVCRPAERSRWRNDTGMARAYPGRIDALREGYLHRGLALPAMWVEVHGPRADHRHRSTSV